MHKNTTIESIFYNLKKLLLFSGKIPDILVEKNQIQKKSPAFEYNLFNVHLQCFSEKQKPKLMVNSTSLKIAFPDRGW